jgi:acetyl-CoA carboxylase biotin carboxyl carrier protein
MTDDSEQPIGADGAEADATAGTTASADAVLAADDEATDSDSGAVVTPTDPGDASLFALIDRLGTILERSELTELEVEAGGTALILRKPAALAPVAASPAVEASPAPAAPPVPASSPGTSGSGSTDGTSAGPAARPSVRAPLTGIWYASPTPGSAPFVDVGRELAVGQVVGLIEAMKLFNEIKSDIAGRVVRVVAESGALVKAKQPLIEVEPL